MTSKTLQNAVTVAIGNNGLKFKIWLGMLLPIFLDSQNYFKHESNKKFH